MLSVISSSLSRPLGSVLAAFVSGRRSLSALEMQARVKKMVAPKMVAPKPAFPGKSSLNHS